MPWHVTAFYPTYKLTDRPPTPVESLRQARDIGRKEGLLFVYEGNIPGEGGENTYCPGCGTEIISRYGMSTRARKMTGGHCAQCQQPIPGVWAA
jgi:pyruvate formate lyase activating enzyme